MLPAHAIRNDVASLEDVANVLANHAMLAHTSQQESGDGMMMMPENDSAAGAAVDRSFHVNELMEYMPRFQYGMDVNPRFTDCLGYEYTAEVTVFDMMACGRLVHGWLVDPIHNEAEAVAVGTKTYNELMDKLIAGQEAESQLAKLQNEIDELKSTHPQLLLVHSRMEIDLLDDNPEAVAAAQVQTKLAGLIQRQNDLQEAATHSHLIQHFLHESSHQLTTFGLERLHETLRDDELCVFFRNNHYCTMTKHEKQLYLLVTDLGYANQLEIVWEKLDVVDGDTEFCNSEFSYNPATNNKETAGGPTLTPEQLLAASSQKEADYHLALHLANRNDDSNHASDGALDDEEGQIMAAATEASLREYNGLPPVVVTAPPPTFPPDSGIEVGVPIPNNAAASGNNNNNNTNGGSSSRSRGGVTAPPQPTVVDLPPPKSSNHYNSNASGTGTQQQPEAPPPTLSQEEADRLLAIQLANEQQAQADAAAAASAAPSSGNNNRSSHHDDAHLAQQLQREEDQRAQQAQAQQRRRASSTSSRQQQRPPQQQPPSSAQQRSSSGSNRPLVPNQSGGNCTIM